MGLWKNGLKRHLLEQVKFKVLVTYVFLDAFPSTELSVELAAGPFWTDIQSEYKHIQLFILAWVSSVTDGFGV